MSKPLSAIPESVEADNVSDDLDDFGFDEDFSSESRSELDVALQEQNDLLEEDKLEEPEAVTPDEVNEETPPEEEEVVTPEEVAEEASTEEEAADELFYDPSRDGEEGISPNIFKDRPSANLGLISKGSYMEKLITDLKGMGSDIGALSLPKMMGEDPDAIGEKYSVEAIGSMTDDDARAAIVENDKFIASLKGKIDRVKTEQEQTKLLEDSDQAINESGKEMADILLRFGMTREEIAAVTDDDAVFDRFDKRISELEENADDLIIEKTYSVFAKEMDGLRADRAKLQALVDTAAKAVKAKGATTPVTVTQDMIDKSLNEFKLDQPDSWIFKDETGNTMEALVRTAKLKGWEMHKPSSWVKNAEQFRKIIEGMQTTKVVKQIATPAKSAAQPGVKKDQPIVYAAKQPAEPVDQYLDRQLDDFMETELFTD